MIDKDLKQHIQEQLERILNQYESLKVTAKYEDLSDLGVGVAFKFITLARAAIERIAGPNSAYNEQFLVALNHERTHDHERLQMIIGIIESLYLDLQAGYLDSVSDLLHGEIFADFLEMAEYLLNEGYKDAAAVICGGTMESHLRQLCGKNGIETEIVNQNGVFPKRADEMNADLARKNIYSKLFQKSITAWLDLRNKAAHGKYAEYSKDQVGIMVAGVRDFITRNPA